MVFLELHDKCIHTPQLGAITSHLCWCGSHSTPLSVSRSHVQWKQMTRFKTENLFKLTWSSRCELIANDRVKHSLYTDLFLHQMNKKQAESIKHITWCCLLLVPTWLEDTGGAIRIKSLVWTCKYIHDTISKLLIKLVYGPFRMKLIKRETRSQVSLPVTSHNSWTSPPAVYIKMFNSIPPKMWKEGWWSEEDLELLRHSSSAKIKHTPPSANLVFSPAPWINNGKTEDAQHSLQTISGKSESNL